MAVGAGGGRPVEQPPVGAGGEGREPGGQRPGRGVAIGFQRGGEVAEQRCGPGVAARVGGDPDRLVGGDDAPVERRGGGRVGLVAEQHGDEGVDEQGPAGEGVGAGCEVEGVDPHAGGAEVDVGAADRLGQAAVLVLGVDNRDLDPRVQATAALRAWPGRTCPHPERARMTELWLSWAKRSHSTSPDPLVVVP